MSLVSLSNAHFDYGREHILRGVNLAVHASQRCALVGANGSGKTTLLAALAGDLALQGGTRQLTGGVRIRLLHQETTLDPAGDDAQRLLDAVAHQAFAKERALEGELATVARLLVDAPADDHDGLVARQGALQQEFERVDGYTVQARLEAALCGVGLAPSTWETPVVDLSGGERRRAARTPPDASPGSR